MKVLERVQEKAYCECICGVKKWVNFYAVRRGAIKSCGCLKRKILKEKNTTHGKRNTSEYVSWSGMRNRCNNPNNRKYAQYGKRGIKVCSRWDCFTAFLEDMGLKPSARHSLDRIDVNGDYSPENCRWATSEEQARNKTTSRLITANGKTLTLAAWSRQTGIDRRKIADRIGYGWTPERALELI